MVQRVVVRGSLPHLESKHFGDAARSDSSGYAFRGLTTRTPYTDTHAATDAGKDVVYSLRWQHTKGENGASSDVVTGKVRV